MDWGGRGVPGGCGALAAGVLAQVVLSGAGLVGEQGPRQGRFPLWKEGEGTVRASNGGEGLGGTSCLRASWW